MNKESGKITTFFDLDAWKEGHMLVLKAYELTKAFPREEAFGLASQMRRSAVSITSNVAEGFSRNSSREKIQFYSIALGSVTELQNQLVIARDVGYISTSAYEELQAQSVKVHKIVNGLVRGAKSRFP